MAGLADDGRGRSDDVAEGAVPGRVPGRAPTPAGTSASSAEGRYDEAYAVAAEVNPFPSVCGWICTAPCEVACRRGVLDEPIAIRTLKRFAAEHGHLPTPGPRPGGGRSGSRSSAAVRPACRPRSTSPASATR